MRLKGHGHLIPYMHVMSIHDRGRGIMPVSTIGGAQLRPFDLEFLEPEVKTIQRENSEVAEVTVPL